MTTVQDLKADYSKELDTINQKILALASSDIDSDLGDVVSSLKEIATELESLDESYCDLYDLDDNTELFTESEMQEKVKEKILDDMPHGIMQEAAEYIDWDDFFRYSHSASDGFTEITVNDNSYYYED